MSELHGFYGAFLRRCRKRRLPAPTLGRRHPALAVLLVASVVGSGCGPSGGHAAGTTAAEPTAAALLTPEVTPMPTPTPEATPTTKPRATATPHLRYGGGVSLAGAEFADTVLPGTYDSTYTYPNAGEVDYFQTKGMSTFRLPFRWERLQRKQFAAFDAAEQARMDAIVRYATSKGAYVIVDPHNFARYYGAIIGERTVPVSAYADFWSRLADHYRDNGRVIFALMNEPNTMSSELWVGDANAAIRAIRATGAKNLILVPGNAWTGAASWGEDWYGTSNAVSMLRITDPGHNFAFEVHQYLDSDASGTQDACVNSKIGSARMAYLTSWLKKHGKRAFLGEFGAAANATCLAALDDLLTYLDRNSSVYLGWTYWAAGPRWGDYFMSIEPPNGAAQMTTLSRHLP